MIQGLLNDVLQLPNEMMVSVCRPHPVQEADEHVQLLDGVGSRELKGVLACGLSEEFNADDANTGNAVACDLEIY